MLGGGVQGRVKASGLAGWADPPLVQAARMNATAISAGPPRMGLSPLSANP